MDQTQDERSSIHSYAIKHLKLDSGVRQAFAVVQITSARKHVNQLAVTAGWMALNTVLQHGTFDPYPFVFFNLLLAVLVALQGPLIVMSQNRQSLKDRARSDTDFKVNIKNEVNIETILRELGEFRAETNTRLEKLESR